MIDEFKLPSGKKVVKRIDRHGYTHWDLCWIDDQYNQQLSRTLNEYESQFIDAAIKSTISKMHTSLSLVKESLQECEPSVEDYPWGPCYELVLKRRMIALREINKLLKRSKSI